MDVAVYDSTLRLGVLGTGFHPSIGDAVAVLRQLADLGVAYVEVGDTPRDATLLARARAEVPDAPALVAYAPLPLADPGRLAGADVVTVGVSARAADAQLDGLREALRALGDRRVFVAAEHAVDGWLADPAYAREVFGCGAEAVLVCDTLGGALPWQVAEVVEAALECAPVVGVQAFDDAGCATANELSAVRAGASLAVVTVNGYGPRCGAADLAAVVAGVETKLGGTALPPGRLAGLRDAAHAVAEVANVVPDPDQPYVGVHAFAQRATAATHVDPALVGNDVAVVVTPGTGRAGMTAKARSLGVAIPEDMAGRVVDVVRQREAGGYAYDAAEASLELLLRAEVEGRAPRAFDLESWRAIVERRADGEVTAEATVKAYVEGRRVVSTGEGDGPVDALDTALRSAVGAAHPALARMELVDYKVRILDASHGTGAVTRVLVTTSDGEREWTTVGAGANVIDASWQALDDAYAYGLTRRKD